MERTCFTLVQLATWKLARQVLQLDTLLPPFIPLYREDVLDIFNNRMEEAYSMAQAKKSNGAKKTSYNGWRGFVNVPLTADSRHYFDLWSDGQTNWTETLATLLEQGYKISQSYVASNRAFNASMTMNAEGHPHQGYTLSAMSPDPITSLLLLIYKHTVLCEETWPIEGVSSDRPQWG